jgi:nicotinate-nucleotide adenylyltransferase
MTTKKHVALYGGSFDPPHLGHVMVVSHLLLNDPTIDEITVMPCFQHMEKAGLSPYDARFDMSTLAFGFLNRTEVSTLEAELGGGSLTVRTVRAMKEKRPDIRVSFIMGSDLIQHAHEWEGWDELLLEATPLIVGRAGIPSQAYDGRSVSKGGTQLKTPTYTPISPAVSSTEVRDALVREAYAEAERYLPKTVLDYIRNRKLYVPGRAA